MPKVVQDLWIIQSAWGGANFDIVDVYDNKEEATKEYNRLREDELEDNWQEKYDTDDLDEAWKQREYNGCDQQEYELLSW